MNLDQLALVMFHYRLHLKALLCIFPRENTILIHYVSDIDDLIYQCMSLLEAVCVTVVTHNCSELKLISVFSSIE